MSSLRLVRPPRTYPGLQTGYLLGKKSPEVSKYGILKTGCWPSACSSSAPLDKKSSASQASRAKIKPSQGS